MSKSDGKKRKVIGLCLEFTIYRNIFAQITHHNVFLSIGVINKAKQQLNSQIENF